MSARYVPFGWTPAKRSYDLVLVAGTFVYLIAYLHLGPLLGDPARRAGGGMRAVSELDSIGRSLVSVREERWKVIGDRLRSTTTTFDRRADPREQRPIADPASPLVVEGVHAVPAALSHDLRARCVPVEALLVVDDEELHRGHFSLRGADRPADRYLARFASIRHLQEHLVNRARGVRVPVIDNANVDQTLSRLMELVLDAVGGIER